MIKKKNKTTDEKTKKGVKAHDLFFRSSMVDLNVAKDFFLEYIPPNFLKRLDIESLRQEKDSLPNETLHDGYMDILYSAQLSETKAYFWMILLEQQTQQDAIMPYRIQKYMLGICEEHRKKYPDSKFPVIFPMIIYTGKSKYTAPLSFWELFEEPSLSKSFFTGPVTLIELPGISYEKLRKRKYSGFLLYFMKLIHEKDILTVLKDEKFQKMIFNMSKENIPFVERALWYILLKGESLSKDEVFQVFKDTVTPKERERIMKIAEEIRQEGMQVGLLKGKEEGKQEGKQEGLQEGLQKGRHEEKIIIAKNLLSQAVDTKLIMQVTGLSEGELISLRESMKEKKA
jgi:predicted transposase YdaD